jgi:hypothetical protein
MKFIIALCFLVLSGCCNQPSPQPAPYKITFTPESVPQPCIISVDEHEVEDDCRWAEKQKAKCEKEAQAVSALLAKADRTISEMRKKIPFELEKEIQITRTYQTDPPYCDYHVFNCKQGSRERIRGDLLRACEHRWKHE